MVGSPALTAGSTYFLFMLIIGGIVLDKMGVRFTGVASCILMIIGCSIKYYAISDAFTMEGEAFRMGKRK